MSKYTFKLDDSPLRYDDERDIGVVARRKHSMTGSGMHFLPEDWTELVALVYEQMSPADRNTFRERLGLRGT